MAYGYDSKVYNAARIPRITGYEFIRDHFKEVVPIRGRSVECKPLGQNRRFTWYEVAENTNCYMSEVEPLGRLEKSYACRLGKHDMVEFFLDGSIVIRDNHWHSPTSMGFLTHSLKAFGTIVSFSGKWYFQNHAGKQYLLPSNAEGLKIAHVGDGFYEPTNPIQEYTLAVKRKEMNKHRKIFKEFMDYTRTMLAMDERISMDTAEALGFNGRGLVGAPNYWSSRNDPENRAMYMGYLEKVTANNDLDLMYSLAQFTASAFGQYRYNHKGVTCTPAEFDRGFAEFLKYQFSDVVFEHKPVPLGEGFSNRNQRYAKSK